MKPTGSQFPVTFDTDETLYAVEDALVVSLAVDYYPGHSIIIAEGDISKFPPSGIITLVDQCSAVHERAVSFYYGKRTSREFVELELISDSSSFKPKKLTKITMQVMSDHREALKSAVLSIENYLGKKHSTEDGPNGKTIFGRINFLRKILFAPKAWFEADVTTGIAPFTVNFTFTGTGNVGPVGDVTYNWIFDEDEIQTVEPAIEKVFLTPGNHSVSLTVKNNHGENTIKFVDMIKVKGVPPEAASLVFLPQNGQVVVDNRIRTPTNYPVSIQANQKKDVITNYTWNLNDNLAHSKSATTKALYSIGGLYDAAVKTETALGSYRVTVLPKAIDVVEPKNLWLWNIDNTIINSYEFGLISEVFKTSKNTFDTLIDNSFLDKDKQKFEFARNNGAATKGQSGLNGTALLFWASGRKPEESSADERINAVEYNGFTDVYTKKASLAIRPWNWAALISPKHVYFILGLTEGGAYPTLSMTNQLRTIYDIESGVSSSQETSYTQYLNSSVELMKHEDVFDANYDAPHGHFAAYRTTWKENTGFLLRNSQLGENFTFQNFYKTSGTIGVPFQQVIKLPDLPGDWNKEGDLVDLEHGVYFFNNHGSAYCFNDVTGVWESIPSHNKVAKSQSSKLLATSDKGGKAYITMDDGTFFKFNEIDMSYSTLPSHPSNKQWLTTLF